MAGGRPPKYSKTSQMELDIKSYFDKCDKENRPYTIAGLALALDMTTQALRDYQKKEEFLCIIKAKQRIESSFEERLSAGNATGSIFWLKNHAKYRDEHHQRMTFDFSKLTDEELEAIAAGQSEA